MWHTERPAGVPRSSAHQVWVTCALTCPPAFTSALLPGYKPWALASLGFQATIGQASTLPREARLWWRVEPAGGSSPVRERSRLCEYSPPIQALRKTSLEPRIGPISTVFKTYRPRYIYFFNYLRHSRIKYVNDKHSLGFFLAIIQQWNHYSVLLTVLHGQ